MPVADQSWPGNISCRFLMNWYGSFVPRQPGCKLLPKLLDTHAYTKLSSLTLLNPADTRSLRFHRRLENPDATAARPHQYKGENEEHPCGRSPGPVTLNSAPHRRFGKRMPTRLIRDRHRRQILNRLRHHKNEDASAVKTRIMTFGSMASRLFQAALQASRSGMNAEL
jgi:hypothetical protein